MAIGLLLCDRVRPDMLAIAGDYPDMFADLLPGLDLLPFDLAWGGSSPGRGGR